MELSEVVKIGLITSFYKGSNWVVNGSELLRVLFQLTLLHSADC